MNVSLRSSVFGGGPLRMRPSGVPSPALPHRRPRQPGRGAAAARPGRSVARFGGGGREPQVDPARGSRCSPPPSARDAPAVRIPSPRAPRRTMGVGARGGAERAGRARAAAPPTGRPAGPFRVSLLRVPPEARAPSGRGCARLVPPGTGRRGPFSSAGGGRALVPATPGSGAENGPRPPPATRTGPRPGVAARRPRTPLWAAAVDNESDGGFASPGWRGGGPALDDGPREGALRGADGSQGRGRPCSGRLRALHERTRTSAGRAFPKPERARRGGASGGEAGP